MGGGLTERHGRRPGRLGGDRVVEGELVGGDKLEGSEAGSGWSHGARFAEGDLQGGRTPEVEPARQGLGEPEHLLPDMFELA